MAQTEYKIEIPISASQKDVWEAVTGFSEYEKWNSVLHMKDNDSLEVGNKFNVTITNKKNKQSSFQATLISKNGPDFFAARQTIIGRWFFSATHHFEVKPQAEDQSVFIQRWELTGILSRLFKKSIFKQLSEFQRMNEELKTYAESNQTSS